MLHRAHKWLQELKYGASVVWPADIRDEIISCALTLCVAESDICWRVSERISATDATPSDGGAAYTLVSDEFALALYRAAEGKGFATTLRQDLVEMPQLESDPLPRDFFVRGVVSPSAARFSAEPTRQHPGAR